MRRMWALTAAAGLLWLPACAEDSGSGGRPGTTTSAPSSPSPTPTVALATEAQLKAALLTVEDLPTGWSTAPDDDEDDDSFAEGCKPLTALDEAFDDTNDSAEQSYSQDDLGPYLSEGASSLASADEVSTRMAALDEALGKCPSFEYKDDEGKTQKVRIADVSFPQVGDERVATRITVEFEGGRLVMTVVAVRVRNHALLLAGTSVHTAFGGGQISAGDFETIVRTAVEKAEEKLP